MLHVPNSTRGYTRSQISNRFGPPDWFPESHPAAPKIVLEGRTPEVPACGYCHLPNGFGRPENAGLAGLPAAYIEQQLDDFKNNRRHNAVPRMGISMIPVASAATPEEVKEAAEYFASVKPAKWIRVVETETVPRFHAAGRMWVPDQDGETEPIGERVIEMPENTERVEIRDESASFVAYAPPGSLKKGEDLVRNGGNGKTIACVTCHGQDLKGLGTIPSIAGRSPSSIGRQIFDFQTGARNGLNAALMKAPVSKLTNADVVAITAYLASLNP
jgi:cytochrome c553